jgi:membrane associated rhomboid family serine protease
MIILPTEKRFDWSNPPYALLLIIALNLVIFFFYQFGDNVKFETAIRLYQQAELFEVEWPKYQIYLKESDQSQRLDDYQELYQDGDSVTLMMYMLYDQQFYQYLSENSVEILDPIVAEKWKVVRQHITSTLFSTSVLRFGQIPSRLDYVNKITYQFLHSGLMHLLGNMFFLIVCGFAVEAAIGHVRFMLFYLLSGIAGGLLHSVSDLQSVTPLIGASGSISGVMAMYLVIFRKRKIEFFYWFYVFIGYFRAPAIVILPFYIGKELFNYFSPGVSNIGFLAHTGGFVFGALQIAILILFKRNLLDEKYIEEDQNIDPERQALADIYQALEDAKFQKALKKLNEYLESDHSNFELQRLKYQLLKLLKGKQLNNHVIQILALKNLSEKEVNQQERIYCDHPHLHGKMKNAQLSRLGVSFCSLDDISTAEDIFKLLQDKKNDNNAMGVLARKLSVYFKEKKNQKKHGYYDSLAESYLAGDT